MDYLLFANIVAVFHGLLVLAVLFGILLSARYKRFRPVEAGVLLISIVIWSLYSGCPLTYLEDYFRNLAGAPTSILDNGFISFYLERLFSLSLTNYEITLITYITAFIFLAISIEWINPIVNFEIVKVRKFFSEKNKNTLRNFIK